MWPYDIDKDYLKAVKPNGLLRSWWFCKTDTSATLQFKAQFYNAGTLVDGQDIGQDWTIASGEFYTNIHKVIFHPIQDLHSFDFDTIRQDKSDNVQVRIIN